MATQEESVQAAIASDLDVLAAQEKLLEFPSFNGDVAWALGSRLREMAAGTGRPVAMAIWMAGQTLFYTTTRGTNPGNEDWLRRKRKTVERFAKSSYRVGTEMRREDTTLAVKHGLLLVDYADHGGGFPLLLAGSGCVGAVVLSGLAQRDDHALVVEAIMAITGITAPRLTP